jgi:hypothetical protein
VGSAAALAALLWTALGGPQDRAPERLGDSGSPIELAAPAAADPSAVLALERGLSWLAEQQDQAPDGSLARAGGERHVPVPTTAIAALAFMAAGSSPERGPYGRNVARAIDYLLLRAELTPGSKTRGYIASEGDELSRMHGHGFATLALTQAYAMSPKSTRGRRVSEVLEAAIDLIERTQGLEGGWFYEPAASAQHENSVTVGLVQSLRAARDSGFEVDHAVVSRAVDYVRRCQTETGHFRYALGTDKTSLALTAAGVSTLNFLGEYEGPEVARGMERLWQDVQARGDEPPRGVDFPHYERLYLALALWQHPDPRLFREWFNGESARLIREQAPDGSWDDPQFGAGYATAMNCLFLGLPQNLLPTFQR